MIPPRPFETLLSSFNLSGVSHCRAAAAAGETCVSMTDLFRSVTIPLTDQLSQPDAAGLAIDGSFSDQCSVARSAGHSVHADADEYGCSWIAGNRCQLCCRINMCGRTTPACFHFCSQHPAALHWFSFGFGCCRSGSRLNSGILGLHSAGFDDAGGRCLCLFGRSRCHCRS